MMKYFDFVDGGKYISFYFFKNVLNLNFTLEQKGSIFYGVH